MASPLARAGGLFCGFKGALKICAYDDETEELDEIVSTRENLQVVRIPGHYWQGFKR